MAGYYRGFCKKFSDIVAPLTSLTSVSQPFEWSPGCMKTFQSAKAVLCGTPVLIAPNFECPFKLELDASASGAGAVLLHEDDHGINHPICYFSKNLANNCNIALLRKKNLSCCCLCSTLKCSSSQLPVVVYIDHNPLVFLARMRNRNQRLTMWFLLLQDFNLEIRHKKGTENVLADSFSRVSWSIRHLVLDIRPWFCFSLCPMFCIVCLHFLCPSGCSSQSQQLCQSCLLFGIFVWLTNFVPGISRLTALVIDFLWGFFVGVGCYSNHCIYTWALICFFVFLFFNYIKVM